MDTVPDLDPKDDVRRRRLRRIALFAAPVVLVLVILGSYRLIVAAYLKHRAAGLGVDLDFDGFTIKDDVILLDGARARLDGVHGLVVEAESVRLGRKGSKVTSVDASKVKVDLEGSATDRVLELSEWSSEHTETYRLPGAAREVRVAWRAAEGDAPWLTADGGSLTSDGKSARFVARTAGVGGFPLGQVEAGFAVDTSGVSIELGKAAGAEAPIAARVVTSASPPRVDITLRPVRVESLGAALGMSLPAPRAVASGRATLTLGKKKGTEAITGSAELLLDGFTPPHPRELSGVISGKKTSLSAAIAVAADRSKVTLSDVAVRAGKLELKGNGTITRAKDHALASLELKGPIACADIARGVAKERLGVLGELAGDAASGAVEGSVMVNVTVEADSRDLAAAKVKPKIGVGCGLKLPF
jgi:hypothetical protein